MGRAAVVGAAVGAALLTTAGPAQAGIWTPVPSGTTADITAIEYQSPSRLWFVTGAGSIHRWNGSSFEQALAPTGLGFTDIDFQPGGNIGLAVGAGGQLYRSTDAGATWSPVGPGTFSHAGFNNTCDVAVAGGTWDSVRFQGAGTVWMVGSGSQIGKSSPGSPANVGGPGTWVDANRQGSVCRIQEDVDDVFTVGTSVAYFVAKGFGDVYLTTNGLTSPAARLAVSAGNGFEGRRRIAGDPSNPNRQWAVIAGGGGSYTGWTDSTWSAGDSFRYVTDEERYNPSSLYDLAFAGGTVLSAGDGGRIIHSIDGRTFHGDPADGTLRTAGWRAVALADGARGAVGGQGGAFAMTTAANVIPAPPATPTPPATTPTPLPPPRPTPPRRTGSGTSLPQPTFTLSGAGNSVTARRVAGKRISVRMRGTLRLPRGISRARGCRGKVTLRLKRGRRTIGRKTVRVNSRCRFSVTVRVKRSKLSSRATRVTAVLTFRDNPFLATRSQTLSVPIR